MLKRLELIGFKSFADRTRFDFAPGITAVVGPNGSGKSNVVDAVRWLLGEQSAKSLRGGEMTDVIFNGSSTRKSLGLAEVSMTFDNVGRLLGLDADDVTITRRVYRDGEGEYLLNGRPARRKDVTDLFLGSGAGHGAYSVIEQGRVDALLSSSPADRRAIFEEASGVSRFRAKKAEAGRKLERVDADLLRVHDILRELDGQLRTLRLAAAKAEKFAEHTARLRAIRLGRDRAEFADVAAKLQTAEVELAGVGAELTAAADATAGHEGELKRLDWELSRVDDGLRHHEGKRADARRRIASFEATAAAAREQADGLAAERLRLGAVRVQLVRRTRAAEADAGRLAADVQAAADRASHDQHQATAATAAEEAATKRAAALTKQRAADQTRQFEVLDRAGRLAGDATSAAQAVIRLTAEVARKTAADARTAAEAEAVGKLLAGLGESDADLQARLAEARDTHQQAVAGQAELRGRLEALQATLDVARQERSAAQGRADALAARERELDGFGAGVRAVLARHRAGDPALAGVVGLVAELVSAPRELAPLVDLALGDAAQRFVVHADRLPAVLAALGEVPGRVGFIPLGAVGESVPGATGGVWGAVSCDVPGLADRLLGQTHLLDRLPATPGQRCVTRGGALLEPDGTVVVGPADAGGFLSRKSELRDLHARLAELDAHIAAAEAQQQVVRTRADELATVQAAWEAEIAALSGEAGSLREKIAERRQSQRQLLETRDLLAAELRMATTEAARAVAAKQEAEDAATAADAEARALAARLAAVDADLLTATAARDQLAAARRDAEVAAGRSAEQLAALRRRHAEVDAERRQRQVDAVNQSAAEAAVRQKLTTAELSALRATEAAAHAFADKDKRDGQVATHAAERAGLVAARDATAAALAALRSRWQGRQDTANALGRSVGELTARRAAVDARLTDLGDAGEVSADESATEDELRQKLAKLGAVNPEAVAELAVVAAREQELRRQFDDLSAARAKLTDLVEAINADSRRLFAETLAAVRGHFQELFRKLFGGGSADVVLDGDDPLTAGIEVTAKPPGKQAQKLSLLSGGERALTAVALLLALFRTKPSPFCLLDEVDAAMDEANTQRLASALREFAGRTQFVVVTHKKRTMAAADVLYGVTMQESGVSKRVSVRFDDWPDDAPAAQAA